MCVCVCMYVCVYLGNAYKYSVHKERTLLPLAGQWYPVWSKKKHCRFKLIWYLKILDKFPIFPFCAFQVEERALFIPFRLLKMAVNEVLCKYIKRLLLRCIHHFKSESHIFGVFSIKPWETTEPLVAIWNLYGKVYMSGYKWLLSMIKA